MAKKILHKTEDSATIDESAEASVESLEETPAESTEAPTAKTPLVKRAVYKTVYAVAFGTVFSSLLIKKLLIPKDSVIDAALHDGAVAAREALEEHERVVSETVQETHEFLAGEDAAPAAA